MAAQYQICFVTAGNENNAMKIANILVEKRLAPCVSVIPSLKSVYRWQGKVEKSDEFLLIIKSRKTLSKDIIQTVRENHTYTVPEVVFMDIAAGNEEYLDWMGANTLFTSNIPKDKNLRKNP